MRLAPVLAALACVACLPVAGFAGEAGDPVLVPDDVTASPAPVEYSAFALPTVAAGERQAALRLPGFHRGAKKPKAARPAEEGGMPLGPERARILLRSLTVPGWGQASLGHRHAAAWFGAAELGIWSAFTAFRVQETMRQDSYMRTARLFAGIDLQGRDEEYKRIVGAFQNSDQYNLYVVARDAANLYLADPAHPDLANYHAYIAEHSIGGANAWSWSDDQSLLRYRAQRKDAQRASLRANTALGLAIANRIVSALHAARVAGHVPAEPRGTSWHLDVAPPDPADPLAFRAGLRASF
jgi:hypothetical protein